jgi:hypothetical protein
MFHFSSGLWGLFCHFSVALGKDKMCDFKSFEKYFDSQIFFCHCDKILDRNNQNKETFILAMVLELSIYGCFVPSVWIEHYGCKNM